MNAETADLAQMRAGIRRANRRVLMAQLGQANRVGALEGDAVMIRVDRHDLKLEDAADPDAPNRTIRRARVTWVPDTWLTKGTIGQEQHNAAVRFVMAYERGILGARDRSIGRISFNRSAPSGVPDAQLACATDYRQAEQAVGLILSGALAWCVLSTGSVEGWAECKGWRHDRASGYLHAALDRLAEHFGYIKPSKARNTA